MAWAPPRSPVRNPVCSTESGATVDGQKRWRVWLWGDLPKAKTVVGSTRNTIAVPVSPPGDDEGSVDDVEVPVAPVLASQAAASARSVSSSRTRCGFALDDDVEAVGPRVGAGRQDDATVLLEVARLALVVAGAEVHPALVPHRR